MTNREVIERVFDKIENDFSYMPVKIASKNYGNGYYLFTFGDDSVCHFTVKGLKRWLFAVWTVYNEEKKKWHINMFGEHMDYIDKFKPTAVEISYEFDWDETTEFDNVAMYSFTRNIYDIKKAPIARKFQYYGHGKGIIKFTLSAFWHYRITKPLKRFKDINLVYMYLRFAKAMYTLRFKKRNNKFHVNIVDRPSFIPRYEFRLVYTDCDDDYIYDVYHSVERQKKHRMEFFGKEVNMIRGLWLIPYWVFRHAHFEHFENDEAKRGFHYIDKKDEYNAV